jgi:nicotinate-nucleotide adenylyltransferase
MIGVLGGTFDPVHFGHLRPALEVMQALDLEQVRFVPNRIPPHRETPWLDVEHRVQLLKTAIDDQPGFCLDERELQREGHSYMVDTLEALRDDFPAHAVCLILGMDAFLGLKAWHQWRRIPEFCHLVVTTRPGSKIDQAFIDDLPATLATSASGLTGQASGRILLQSVTQLDISASRIRRMLSQGLSVRYLLPDEVNTKLMKMVKS